jgi:hypothetical protein
MEAAVFVHRHEQRGTHRVTVANDPILSVRRTGTALNGKRVEGRGEQPGSAAGAV